MTFNELKQNASFHEVLLIDAAIKAHQEMMDDFDRQVVAHSTNKIAKDYGEIMMKHIIPHLHEVNGRHLKDAFQKGDDEFKSKYGIE